MKPTDKLFANISYHADKIALVLILLAAALLRLWHLRQLPFMHDEFSALFRVGYDSFGELLEKGIQPDAHPAGTQILLHYLTAVFGMNAAWLKLPFILMGIASVWLVYAIGRNLFHKTAGLFCASLVATMQFFVFYSQLARPYSSGLFFVLLAVYFGSRIVKEQQTKSIYNNVGFGVAVLLASMMHYFAMMMAGFVVVSFFFFIRKEQRKTFVITAVVTAIAYLPNIKIFMSQVSAGGIGDWLGKPSSDFIFQFLAYCFHFSTLFFAVAALFYLFFIVSKGIKMNNIKAWTMISWFVLSFTIGWIYSMMRTPVLQYSSLIFSFPFVILGISGFMKELKPLLKLLMVALILTTGTISLIAEREHFTMMYAQGYDQIAKRFSENQSTYGSRILQVNMGGSERMTGFYLQQNQVSNTHFFNKDAALEPFAALLDTSTAQYLAIGWTDYAPYSWVEAARVRFPKVIETMHWFNSGYYLLSRDTVSKRELLQDERFVIQQNDMNGLKHFAENDEYGLLWEARTDSILAVDDGIIVVGYRLKALSSVEGVSAVLEFKSATDGKAVVWRSGKIQSPQVMADGSVVVLVTYQLDSGPNFEANTLLRTYLWNNVKSDFLVLERWMYIKKQNPILFGLYAPLK